MSQTIATQDYEQAATFLSILCGSENTEVTWQTFDDNERNKAKALVSVKHDTLEDYWATLCDYNERGAGVFATVQVTDGSGKRTKANIVAIRALFIDCDNGLPNTYHCPPTMIVDSSPGKGHVYWVLREPVEMTEAEYTAAITQLIDHYNSDPAPKDMARVMRLPGTCNMKLKEPKNAGNEAIQAYPVTLLEADEDKLYTVDEVLKGLKPCSPKKVAKAPLPKPSLAPAQVCVEGEGSDFDGQLRKFCSIVSNAKEGTRNATLNTAKYTLAGAFPTQLDAIDKALTQAALTIGLSLEEITATLASANKGSERPVTLRNNRSGKSKYAMLRDTLVEFYGDKLQWDEMQNKLRFDGALVTLEKLYDITSVELDQDIPWENFKRLVPVLAENNPYHAVRVYLQSLTVATDPEPALSALFQAMGVIDKLQRQMIRKWLISAVARALNPGCQADYALVLHGGQGKRKTSFFRSLFGSFFQTMGEHKSEVDQLLSMACSWCIEWGEIEHALSQKAVAAIKTFMTQDNDVYRRPYASAPDRYPRHFVICGTTNKHEFLTDTTGNRRFWIVDIKQLINTDAVAAMRDEVWASVLALYLAGEPHYFSSIEETKVAATTAQYEQESPWSDLIAQYLTHHTPCTLADIMENALKFDTSRLNDKRAQSEVTAILHQLECTKKQQRINGRKAVYWYAPVPNTDDIVTTTVNIPKLEFIETSPVF